MPKESGQPTRYSCKQPMEPAIFELHRNSLRALHFSTILSASELLHQIVGRHYCQRSFIQMRSVWEQPNGSFSICFMIMMIRYTLRFMSKHIIGSHSRCPPITLENKPNRPLRTFPIITFFCFYGNIFIGAFRKNIRIILYVVVSLSPEETLLLPPFGLRALWSPICGWHADK